MSSAPPVPHRVGKAPVKDAASDSSDDIFPSLAKNHRHIPDPPKIRIADQRVVGINHLHGRPPCILKGEAGEGDVAGLAQRHHWLFKERDKDVQGLDGTRRVEKEHPGVSVNKIFPFLVKLRKDIEGVELLLFLDTVVRGLAKRHGL